MDTVERRRRTSVAAERRKRKIKEISNSAFNGSSHDEYIENIPDGKYRNNNIANKFFCGWKKKTKTKNSCASYRHHGGYGSAKRLKPHDQRQIDREKDYYENND